MCAQRDSDRRTNARAVTLQAGSLHPSSSEAHFKWHRELRCGVQNDTPPKVRRETQAEPDSMLTFQSFHPETEHVLFGNKNHILKSGD